MTTDTVIDFVSFAWAGAAVDTSFETVHVRHVRFAMNRLAHSFAKLRCVVTELR